MQKDKVLQLMVLFSKKLGGSISDVKMMKLLYFTDRLSLVTTGHPISYDSYYALNRGPILSGTKALIDAGSEAGFEVCADSKWSATFTAPVMGQSPKGFPLKHFSLIEGVIDSKQTHDALCEAEIEFAEQIFADIAELDDDEIVAWSHRKDVCPEWTWPDGSRKPIQIDSIFRTIGMSEHEIAEQIKEIDYHKRLLVD